MTDKVKRLNILSCFKAKPTDEDLEVAYNMLDDIEESIGAKRSEFVENDTEHDKLRIMCVVKNIKDSVYDTMYKELTEYSFGCDKGYFISRRNCPDGSEIEFTLWFDKESA